MILAAAPFRTNADIIHACRDLGYIRDDSFTLDPTYGKGTWWKLWRPTVLVTHDIRQDGVDFRQLPHQDATFDVAAFDPPYVAVGGRATSKIGAFNDSYGLVEVPKTPDELDELIVGGLAELARVVRPNGYVFFKGMNYVTSGKYTPQAYDALIAASMLGFRLADEFIHLRKPGPQPARSRQVHARRNYSHMFVLQRRKD